MWSSTLSGVAGPSSSYQGGGNSRMPAIAERQIVLLVCTGLSNKQIAQRLDVTKGTVEVHLHNIYVKFAMPNRTMLALLALHLGVTAPTIGSNI
jgi:DNA-binding NarL/FixJ family response regulator